MYKKIYKNMNLMALFTLLLTALLILSAAYTTFSARIKSEVTSEALLIADILNYSDADVNLISHLDSFKTDRKITLTSADKTVLFNNKTSQSYSFEYDTAFFSYTVKLKNNDLLTVTSTSHNIIKLLLGFILPLFIVIFFIYIICRVFAKNLTENIVKPINTINLTSTNYNNVYEELIPFIKRMAGQNDEIKHQIEKVKREKSKLQAISDNMSEGLVVLGKKGLIISANNSSTDIFDLDKENIINKNIFSLSDDKILLEALNSAYGGEKGNVVLNVNAKTYHTFFSPVFEQEIISGVIILFFDISEEVKAAEIRKEFSANVSHELKTPLTTILGYSQIINNNIAKPEDIQNFTKKIEHEASRLLTLIDDIIKLSKLDESRTAEEKKNINLRNIVLETIELLKQKANERNISFLYNNKDTDIYANERQIFELVYNLCDNAVKYNKDNGQIHISVEYKTLIVSDTGVGIPKEYIDRIFERFFRVDKSRSKRVNGTGLGLSIVKHIAMQNDAEIFVETELDKGTTFKVQFK